MTYFEQNEFMQQDMSAHVGQSHTGHDDQAADQETLRPCLQNEAHAVGGLIDDEHHDVTAVALRRKCARASQSRRSKCGRCYRPSFAAMSRLPLLPRNTTTSFSTEAAGWPTKIEMMIEPLEAKFQVGGDTR